jgi:tripartite-type tricarboxylate transporter receptor subunit TctC
MATTSRMGFVRRIGWLVCALIVAGIGSHLAFAQGYPTKPIRVIITLSPGSANDIIPRFVLEHVAQSVGQPFIFENRPGASGTIAATAVAKANPDGYTILALSTTHAMAPGVIKSIPYDTTGDFAGITTLASLPHLLVTGSEQKVRSISDLVAAAKSRPGGLTYGAILGAGPHLNAVHFLRTMGVEGRLVPFKGAPEALTEVMAGRLDIYFSPITPALPFLQSGKVQAVAVTSKNRSNVLPDVPTTFEQGYPDSEFGLWVGIAAPAKTPREIVEKLHTETVKALGLPGVQARLKQMGAEPMILEPAAFDALIRKELAFYSDIAQKAGLAQQ